MKNLLMLHKSMFIIVFAIILSSVLSLTVNAQVKNETKDLNADSTKKESKLYTSVEVMPSFPGGMEAMMNYFAAAIIYPEEAKHAGVAGKILVQFTVSSKGTVCDPIVLKGIGGGCDEEAIRVLLAMPRWNPGTQNNEPCDVRFSLPIVFALN